MIVIKVPMIDIQTNVPRWEYWISGRERLDGSLDDGRVYWRFETMGM
jgi:hypothetical protein